MTRRSVETHRAVIAALVGPALVRLDTEVLPLQQALGRRLAGAVRTPGPMPPFRNAQMDGYAARAADLLAVPVVLPSDGVQAAAATTHRSLAPGRLLKVMTGAPVPDGADCVVPIEDTEEAGGAVRILRSREPGEYVREAGIDAAPGDLLLVAGTRLAARHLAAAAAAGIGEVGVQRLPRVAVIATGDEVVSPGAPLEFGQVHDANGTALAALVREAGADPVLVELVSDDRAAFEDALSRAVELADLVITAGGVSHGDFEVVRQVLEPLGADVTEIAMQPGGPQGSAVVRGVPVVCLPGNPVSAQVSFIVLVRPVLRAAAALTPIAPLVLPLAAPIDSPAGLRQWRRGSVRDGAAHPVGGPGSHLVAAMAGADVLIDVPEDVTYLPTGASVQVLPL